MSHFQHFAASAAKKNTFEIIAELIQGHTFWKLAFLTDLLISWTAALQRFKDLPVADSPVARHTHNNYVWMGAESDERLCPCLFKTKVCNKLHTLLLKPTPPPSPNPPFKALPKKIRSASGVAAQPTSIPHNTH